MQSKGMRNLKKQKSKNSIARMISLIWKSFVCPAMIMTMTMAMLVLFPLANLPYASGESDHPNRLCQHITSGRIELLQLQSFTYLDGNTDRVLLMEGGQFYEFSSVKSITKEGNRVKPLGRDPLTSSPMLAELMRGSRLEPKEIEAMDLVTVIQAFSKKVEQAESSTSLDNIYYGVIRTSGDIHVVEMHQEYQDSQATGPLETKVVPERFKNLYPHFTLIPQPDTLLCPGFIVQEDKFYNTKSVVVYELDFSYHEPRLARLAKSVADMDINSKRVEPFYLITDGGGSPAPNPKVTLKSVWKAHDRALVEVAGSPLLHWPPVGFVTLNRTLYLIEPMIGCVHILEGFGTPGGLPEHENIMPLTRVPIERFFACDGFNPDRLPTEYGQNRCDKPGEFVPPTTTTPAPPQPQPPGPNLHPDFPSIYPPDQGDDHQTPKSSSSSDDTQSTDDSGAGTGTGTSESDTGTGPGGTAAPNTKILIVILMAILPYLPIIVIVLALILIAIVVGFVLYRRRRRRKTTSSSGQKGSKSKSSVGGKTTGLKGRGRASKGPGGSKNSGPKSRSPVSMSQSSSGVVGSSAALSYAGNSGKNYSSSTKTTSTPNKVGFSQAGKRKMNMIMKK